MLATKKYYSLFLLFILCGCSSISRNEVDEPLWNEFKKNPSSHEIIPDNSYAGYFQGERKIPSIDIQLATNAKKFGALGDGTHDDTKAIQSLLNKGGIIYLPEGKYVITSLLRINKSNTVLIGDGPNKTLLLFRNPLKDIFDKYLDQNNTSIFSWNGGLLDIGPAEEPKKIFKEESGWGLNVDHLNQIAPAKRGDSTIFFRGNAKVSPGDWIFLVWEKPLENKTLNSLAGFPIDKDYSWNENGKAWIDRRLPWPVRVKAVKGNAITLQQPLRMDIYAWDMVYLQKPNKYVENIGIENLKLWMEASNAREHNEEFGFNGIFMHKAFNSWAKNIVIHHADSAVILNAVKNISLINIKLSGLRQFHHGFFTKNSHDCLIQDFIIEAPVIHGINSDMFGSGNVWSRGFMHHGTFDMHHGMQFDLIRTQIFIKNDGASGGEADSGPMQGRRVVHWNIFYDGKSDYVNDPSLMPKGALVGVRCISQCDIKKDKFQSIYPENLYEAQLKWRLENQASH